MTRDATTDAVDALRQSARLRSWLASALDVTTEAPLDVEVISGGYSNLTVGIRMGELDLVLRRPPVGAFLPSANDMHREYTFLASLASTVVPTPRSFGYCEDPDVIGAPFYIMERLHGIVPHDPAALAGLAATDAHRLSARVVDVLVELHALDPDAVGLGHVAKREGYLERQVRRWVGQYERSKDGLELPVVDELASVLRRALPDSPPATIVHGDYRLGNLMVDAEDRTRIIGVFDWEMATLGDPLADVGYLVLYWGTRGRPAIHPSQACADLPGFLTASELSERYAARSGRRVDDLTFYVVLAAFKLSVIGLGQRAVRRRAGAAPDDDQVARLPLAEWALDHWITNRSSRRLRGNGTTVGSWEDRCDT